MTDRRAQCEHLLLDLISLLKSSGVVTQHTAGLLLPMCLDRTESFAADIELAVWQEAARHCVGISSFHDLKEYFEQRAEEVKP